jgi:hypothetical protein
MKVGGVAKVGVAVMGRSGRSGEARVMKTSRVTRSALQRDHPERFYGTVIVLSLDSHT